MSIVSPPVVSPAVQRETIATVTELRPEREQAQRGVDPSMVCLPVSVDVAPTAEERCGHAEGGLPCVRRPHPDHPNAHVRVAGSRCNALAERDRPAARDAGVAARRTPA